MQGKQARLCEVAQIITGVADEKSDDGEFRYRCYQPNCFTESSAAYGLPSITKREPAAVDQLVKPGDVLVKRLNPTFPLLIDKPPGECVVSSNLFIIRCRQEILPVYLAFLLEQPVILNQVLQLSGTNAAITAISKKKLMEVLVPVMPLETQKRLGEWWMLGKKRKSLLNAFLNENNRFMKMVADKVFSQFNATEE